MPMKMAEDERASFFRYSTSRAPGKRQIKPTAAVAEMIIPNDDDEDDEDFVGEIKTEPGSDSDSSSSDDDSGSDEGTSGSLSDVISEEDLKPDVDVGFASVDPVCTVCLNLREECKNDEMISCDKCGIFVHEACYVTDLGEDDTSSSSNASTEPWFCEPCLFGLNEPPCCELCPNRFGAFKKTDIGGTWVHIVCALFTPGCTFGDAEKLTAISYQEIDYSKMFGKKQCTGCSSKVDARVGIASQCDAALCKAYYHPTCAQRLGLLVDKSDERHEDDDSHNFEPRFIHCKKHSREDEMTRKKTAYSAFKVQEERRMVTMKRKRLSDREERTLVRNHRRLVKMHNALEGVTISWPEEEWDTIDKKQRRIRPMHTSKRVLDAFADKAEMYEGVSHEDFEKEFVRVRGENLPFLPPGFSTEFAAYFENREKKVFDSENRRLATINSQNVELKSKLKVLEDNVRLQSDPGAVVEEALTKLNNFYNALVKLGVKKIQNPFTNKMAEVKKARKRANSISGALKSPNARKTPAKEKEKEKKAQKNVLHTCHECHKMSDQHLLIECDQCHFHYHLACLDPPLERMPKKTNFDWHCSNCLDESSEGGDEQEDEEVVEDGPRKLRQRSDITKAKKLQEAEAERHAYRSVMRSSRRPPAKKRKTMDIASAPKEKKDSPSSSNRSLPLRSPTSRTHSRMSQLASYSPSRMRRAFSPSDPIIVPIPKKPKNDMDTGVESEAESEELVWITR